MWQDDWLRLFYPLSLPLILLLLMLLLLLLLLLLLPLLLLLLLLPLLLLLLHNTLVEAPTRVRLNNVWQDDRLRH